MPSRAISVLVRATLFTRHIRPKMNPTERVAYLLIAEGRGRGVHDIARDAALNPGEASRAVRGLVTAGWVVCYENTEDRRRKTLRLTPRGQALLRRLVAAMDATPRR